MARITVPLETEERDALFMLAKIERRDPRLQAALFIRRALESAGAIHPAPVQPARAAEAVKRDQH